MEYITEEMIKNVNEGIYTIFIRAESKYKGEDYIRACPQFILRQIIVQAILNIDLKFLANFSKRVAILRKCFSFAKTFSTKCLIL